VEFYTAFLPLLFWSGHTKLARQLTLLMALCIYIVNSVKDLVCAPRPPSPPVRRIVPMESEKESSLEYGLPSSHSINTLCLSGYLLYYLMGHKEEIGIVSISAIAALLSAIVFLVVFGRLYLGMHTPIDVAAGLAIGALLLLGWCMVDDYVDAFITTGENVLWFWATIAILLLFAYPTPELRTPSFEFHTAFNGVVFGIVSAINRTYLEFHTDVIPIIPLSTWGGIIDLSRRLAIGLPIVLIAKAVSKALAIRVFPVVCNFVGFPICSSHYVPIRISTTHAQCSAGSSKKMDVDHKQVHMSVILDDKASMDVDTGIRLAQYAGVGWAVAELTPYVFHYLAL
jgi:membrane-associated phospholipid phosphatase